MTNNGNNMLAAAPGGQLGMFGGQQQGAGNALAAVTSNAQVTQTLASIWIAKQFPRDLGAVTFAMQQACSRRSLAEKAMFAYPRGGSVVTGVSIRLAEALLGAWGNAEAGWKEIERRFDAKKGCMVSECVAYCFDKETNLRAEIAFSVPHQRDTRKGSIKLEDERDIYELCANMSSRRKRACILQVLPAWLVEEAVERVTETMNQADAGKPIGDMIRNMEAKFGALGVTKEMLEAKLGHALAETTRPELRELGQTYNALADGQARVSDVFKAAVAAPVVAAAPVAEVPKKKEATAGELLKKAMRRCGVPMDKFVAWCGEHEVTFSSEADGGWETFAGWFVQQAELVEAAKVEVGLVIK